MALIFKAISKEYSKHFRRGFLKTFSEDIQTSLGVNLKHFSKDIQTFLAWIFKDIFRGYSVPLGVDF